MKAVLLIGAPGAGKGTTAEGITAKTSFVHTATGDMLREAVKKGTKLGREAKGFMDRGELVPDNVIVKLVEERLDAGSSDAMYLFDGFPRTLAQAELLEKALKKREARLDSVFFLDAPREVLVRRLSGRRTCRDCGRNYHIENIPPKREGVCDACGGELYKRPDDEESTVLNRLEVYARQTESLISYYERKGILVRIDSSQHRDAIVDRIVGMLTKQ